MVIIIECSKHFTVKSPTDHWSIVIFRELLATQDPQGQMEDKEQKVTKVYKELKEKLDLLEDQYVFLILTLVFAHARKYSRTNPHANKCTHIQTRTYRAIIICMLIPYWLVLLHAVNCLIDLI